MATETVVSDHSSHSEEVEKEEVKKMDTECTSDPPKGSVIKKPGESAAEPHLTEPAKDSNADEEPKNVAVSPIEEKVEDKVVTVEVPASGEESITESMQEKVEEKPTDEDKKIEEAPAVEVLDKAIKPEPPIEKVDILCESKSEPEPAEKQSIEPKEVEEVEKVVDVPESLPAEVVEKIEEKVEEPLAEMVEATKAEDVVVVPEAESKPEDIEVKDVAVPLAESKLEATELKDVRVCEAMSEPEEITESALVVEPVETKSSTDKAEDSEVPKEDVISTSEKSDIVKSEDPVSQVEEENVDVCRKTYEGAKLTEPAKECLEPLLDEKTAEPENIEEKTEAPEEKSVVAEELVRTEEKPTEDSKTSVPTPEEPAENVANDEATAKFEKCGTNASPETTEEVKETTEGVERTEAAKNIEETEAKLVEDKQVDEKIKETIEATEANLEEEKKVDEPGKTELLNSEAIKGIEDTKSTQDVSKDVPVKTQKQSIVKIVKQSLVKAKKAIIGKSNNSKTTVPEVKDDGNK